MSAETKSKCDAVLSSFSPVLDTGDLGYQVKFQTVVTPGAHVYCLTGPHGHPGLIPKIKSFIDGFYASKQRHIIMLIEGFEHANPDALYSEVHILKKIAALLSQDPGLTVEAQLAIVSIDTDDVIDCLASQPNTRFSVERQLHMSAMRDLIQLLLMTHQRGTNGKTELEFKQSLKKAIVKTDLVLYLGGRFSSLDASTKKILKLQISDLIDRMVSHFFKNKHLSAEEYNLSCRGNVDGYAESEYVVASGKASNNLSIEKIYKPLAKKMSAMVDQGEYADVFVYFGSNHMPCWQYLSSELEKFPQYRLSDKKIIDETAVVGYLNASSSLKFSGYRRKALDGHEEKLNDFVVDAVTEINASAELESAEALKKSLGYGSVYEASGYQSRLFVLHDINYAPKQKGKFRTVAEKIEMLPKLMLGNPKVGMSAATKRKCDTLLSSVRANCNSDTTLDQVITECIEVLGARIFCLAGTHADPELIVTIKGIIDKFYTSKKQHFIMMVEGSEFGDSRDQTYPEVEVLKNIVASLRKDPGVRVEEKPATISIKEDAVVDSLASHPNPKFSIEEQLYGQASIDIAALIMVAFHEQSHLENIDLKALLKKHIVLGDMPNYMEGRFKTLSSDIKVRLTDRLNTYVDKCVDCFISYKDLPPEKFSALYWSGTYEEKIKSYLDAAVEVSNEQSIEKIYKPLAERLLKMTQQDESVDVFIYFGARHIDCWKYLVLELNKSPQEAETGWISYLSTLLPSWGLFGGKKIQETTADSKPQQDEKPACSIQ